MCYSSFTRTYSQSGCQFVFLLKQSKMLAIILPLICCLFLISSLLRFHLNCDLSSVYGWLIDRLINLLYIDDFFFLFSGSFKWGWNDVFYGLESACVYLCKMYTGWLNHSTENWNYTWVLFEHHQLITLACKSAEWRILDFDQFDFINLAN